jgi:hypothetical protein
MTREEILATTYPLPSVAAGTKPGGILHREEDWETNLRAVVDYESPPPAFVFEGPLEILSLKRRLARVAYLNPDLQEAFERGEVPRLKFEIEQRRNAQHLEALEKAIPMAEAGWEIYTDGWFLAVQVKPE